MSELVRGFIGKEDIKYWDGVSDSFSRKTITGGYESLTRFDSDGVDILYAYGSGSSYTGGTIQSALSAIGSTNKIKLRLTRGTWIVSSDLTIGSNITLQFDPGAILTDDANNANLTINGDIVAGPYQRIFDWGNGSGALTGEPKVDKLFAAWFGWSESATASNNKTYLDQAIALSNGQYTIDLGIGNYNVDPTGGCIIHTDDMLLGHGFHGTTTLTLTADDDFIHFGTGRAKIRNIKIDASTIAFTSSVMTIDGSLYTMSAQNIYSEHVQLFGPTTTESASTGTGILYTIDIEDASTGYGISNTVLKTTYIRGFEYGIRMFTENTLGTAFINNNYLEFHAYRCKYMFWQDRQTGSQRGNLIYCHANGQADSYTALHIEDSANYITSSIYDRTAFNNTGAVVYDFRYTSAGGQVIESDDANVHIETNAIHDPRRFMYCENMLCYEIRDPKMRRLQWDFTSIIPGMVRGTHDGVNNAGTLADSTANFATSSFLGRKVYNLTDGSEGFCFNNTATTVSALLSGGTDNDWDTGDEYLIDGESGNNWLQFSKDGNLATVQQADSAVITISTHPSINDIITVESPRNWLEPGVRTHPWMFWTARHKDAVDYTNSLVKMGFNRTDTANDEFLFVADPTDSLGTGITANWIFRVIDSLGTVTNIDTSVALIATFKDFQITFRNNNLRVNAFINSVLVADVTLGATSARFKPYFYVEALSANVKDFQISDTLELLYRVDT